MGGVLKLLFQLYLALTAQSHSTAYSSLQGGGHRNPLKTPQFGVSPHLLCLVLCP